jgi:hypothetical protein
MNDLIKSILSLSDEVRYIAVYTDGKLVSSAREDLQNASSSESDKYEEFIVNPTLLKLVTQRGAIDCGGAEYVLIRYGYFFVFVKPIATGHISIGIQLTGNPITLIPQIEDLLNKHKI